MESWTEDEATVVAEVSNTEDDACVPPSIGTPAEEVVIFIGSGEELTAVESTRVGMTLSVVEAVEEDSESGVEVGSTGHPHMPVVLVEKKLTCRKLPDMVTGS